MLFCYQGMYKYACCYPVCISTHAVTRYESMQIVTRYVSMHAVTRYESMHAVTRYVSMHAVTRVCEYAHCYQGM